jgi:D-serine deaminase-like pyridoxal phosphate-dependent protein
LSLSTKSLLQLNSCNFVRDTTINILSNKQDIQFNMKLSRPTLLVDEDKCRNNIERMAAKAKSSGVLFRPHFKTHQSAAVGEWFREYGVDRITVSSVEMAEYFAAHGWLDILVAFPVNVREIVAINRLAADVSLHLLLESVVSARFLHENLKSKTGVWLKIDTGNQRTGLSAGSITEIMKVTGIISRSEKLTFNGFLAHDGHTYSAKSREEIVSIHQRSVTLLNNLKKEIEKDFHVPLISLGDTPSCSIIERFEGLDEIRPGNFVFFDVMQYALGTCSLNDIAVAMACPVVAIHRQRNQMVIHGGAVHLSKEFLDMDGLKHYGLVVLFTEQGWSEPVPDCYVQSVSQEHGIIHASDELLETINIGDLVGILPVHACLTASLFRHFCLLDGRQIETSRT